MLLRPADASGDILPVLSSSALFSGPEAVALLVQDRLSLLRGNWWENPETAGTKIRPEACATGRNSFFAASITKQWRIYAIRSQCALI